MAQAICIPQLHLNARLVVIGFRHGDVDPRLIGELGFVDTIFALAWVIGATAGVDMPHTRTKAGNRLPNGEEQQSWSHSQWEAPRHFQDGDDKRLPEEDCATTWSKDVVHEVHANTCSPLDGDLHSLPPLGDDVYGCSLSTGDDDNNHSEVRVKTCSPRGEDFNLLQLPGIPTPEEAQLLCLYAQELIAARSQPVDTTTNSLSHTSQVDPFPCAHYSIA